MFAPPLPPPPPPPLTRADCTQSLLSAGVHHFISVPLPLVPFAALKEEWVEEICDTLLSLFLDYLYGKTGPDVSIFTGGKKDTKKKKERKENCLLPAATTSSDPFRTGSVVKSSSTTCYLDDFSYSSARKAL